jgi:hydrogenase expression/formation protein HypC
MSFSVPGKIIEVYPVRNNRLGLVEFGDTRRPVFLDLVPDAGVGDYVTVHVGYATGRVAAEEAERAYRRLGLSGELASAEADLEEEETKPEMRRREKQR